MNQKYGKANGPIIILHGGAGPRDPSLPKDKDLATTTLQKIASTGLKLVAAEGAMRAAVYCVQEMENDPQFNAGLGSAMQGDGLPRLSASLMDGQRQSFSGIINSSYVKNPSLLSLELQNKSSRVLSPPGSELLARELNLPIDSNFTHDRIERWKKQYENKESIQFTEAGQDFDTVGCIVLDESGHLVAASSTGGRGYEFPGRVSDTATVAGNYASTHAAIAATGIGENIVDDALAARLETRIRDGLSLEKASKKCFEEAKLTNRSYGWIVLDKDGNWGIAHLTKSMPYYIAHN